jgi:hypothetical protein
MTTNLSNEIRQEVNTSYIAEYNLHKEYPEVFREVVKEVNTSYNIAEYNLHKKYPEIFTYLCKKVKKS